MYLHLFNAITDALEALSQSDPVAAENILKTAQTHTEAMYIEDE